VSTSNFGGNYHHGGKTRDTPVSNKPEIEIWQSLGLSDKNRLKTRKTVISGFGQKVEIPPFLHMSNEQMAFKT